MNEIVISGFTEFFGWILRKPNQLKTHIASIYLENATLMTIKPEMITSEFRAATCRILQAYRRENPYIRIAPHTSEAWNALKTFLGFRILIPFHTLRFGFKMYLLERGAGLLYTKELLGYESSKTMEIYTHIRKKAGIR